MTQRLTPGERHSLTEAWRSEESTGPPHRLTGEAEVPEQVGEAWAMAGPHVSVFLSTQAIQA